MKRSRLINAELSAVIANLGHGNKIAIVDAGYPIPQDVLRIDLALQPGTPSFFTSLEVICSELRVESIDLADSTLSAWSAQYLNSFNQLLEQLIKDQGQIKLTQNLSHQAFKELALEQAIAYIRTGECTPYANAILTAGVTF